MFCLSIIKDTIPIHPSAFSAPVDDALIAEINKKYANRVLHDVGLCVAVFDLAQVGEGKVRYGDGYLWYKVVFRMVVFRPFTSEVIVAKVKSSDEDGIRLTLGFFDDIYIPSTYLPHPSAFDPNERAHFWIPDFPSSPTPSPSPPPPPPLPRSESPNRSPTTTLSFSQTIAQTFPQSQPTSTHPSVKGSNPTKKTKPKPNLLDTPLSQRMYIDQGEIVRVRVEVDEFCDDEPGPPKVNNPNGDVAGAGEGAGAGGVEKVKRAPYLICCSIAEQGLGPVVWWNDAQQVGDGDGEEGGEGGEGEGEVYDDPDGYEGEEAGEAMDQS